MGELRALTGLRFIAALLVLVGHSWVIVRFTDDRVMTAIMTGGTPIGMTAFFVLSGFVLWINYAADFQTRPLLESGRRFVVARIARLYPMYLVVGAISFLRVPAEGRPAAVDALPYFLTMTQSWFPSIGYGRLSDALPYFGHAWSMSTEIACYVVFPLLVLAATLLRGFWGKVAFVVACLAALAIMASVIRMIAPVLAPDLVRAEALIWAAQISPLTWVWTFACGCGLGAIWQMCSTTPPSEKERSIAAVLIWIALAFVVICWLRWSAPAGAAHSVFLRVASTAALCYVVFYLARYPASVLTRVTSSPAMVTMGEASYSIYLLHPLIISLLPHAVYTEMTVPLLAWSLAHVLAVAIITIVISLGTYRLIEDPARRWLRARLGCSGPAISRS